MGENVDAILMPVIARSFIKKGKSKILKFAGKDLTLHPNFKLYLQTKLSNPHYPPEVQAEATLINFTGSMLGLVSILFCLKYLSKSYFIILSLKLLLNGPA